MAVDSLAPTVPLLKGRIQVDQVDLMMGIGLVAVLLVMIIPLPAFILDILLSLSITCSLVILLTSTYITKPLEFSTFPSVLLVTTLFRLVPERGLHPADPPPRARGGRGRRAGHRSFGNFVVGGNFLVGFIIFSILVIINFVVITKGSGRIAEVAARFTLDAMPGKQMAIDADLNAGLIDDREARSRRSLIAREAEFYGAMDGASKFVRGEAIAGIIIILINIGGGFIIGMLQQSLSLAVAAQNYTILTIGDALVTQIPALMISTAAGIIVTRAASEHSMGKELGRQFKLQPQAISLSAGILFFFGLIPGLPHLPFISLSLIIGFLALLVFREQKRLAEGREAAEPKKAAAAHPSRSNPCCTWTCWNWKWATG